MYLGTPTAVPSDVEQALDLSLLLDAPPEVLAALPPNVQGEIESAKLAMAEQARQEAQARRMTRQALGQRVLGEYHTRKAHRTQLELRWESELRRYNAQYEANVLKAIESRKYGSTAFVPLTRRVCSIVEARACDLVYPSGDRNFAIESTPVPEMDELQALLVRQRPDAPVLGAPGADGNPQAVTAQAVAEAIKEMRYEAKLKAENMQREVDDQLREAKASSVGRKVIRDAIIYGTGVIKGPAVHGRIKRVWDTTGGQSTLKIIEDLAPGVVHVSPWNFYPDLSTTEVGECTPIELHLLTATRLADLAKVDGFDADAIREVLRSPPGPRHDSHRDTLKEPSATQGVQDNRYEVLEYHGPVTAEELRCMGVEVPKGPDGQDDPLVIFHGVVFVTTSGTVIKAEVNHMATGEHPYSVLNWQEDQGCIFGFGLPYELADLQDLANSIFRAAIDNMGLSVGPQIVVSKGIRPINGQFVIEPNKLWEMTDPNADVRQAFGFFQIDSRTTELLNLFAQCKALMDEVSGSQLAMMGQDAPSYMETARGASMAYNAANIWMRRFVRMFDDGITNTLVQRFVDWNMEHNPKPDIKGDLRVQARGTSALLEAENQAQKIAAFIELAKDIPLKFKNRVAQLREMAKGMRLDTVDLLPTEDEIIGMAEQIDNAQTPPNPEIERLRVREMELQDRAAEREAEMQTAQAMLEMRRAELASKEGITLEELRQRYELGQRKLDAETAKFNAELVVKQRMGSGV